MPSFTSLLARTLLISILCISSARAEQPVSPVALGPATGFDVAIASDGDSYFAAWVDLRSRRAANVFGSRVTADGRLDDPTGILLSTITSRFPEDVQVVWNGSTWVVLWQESFLSIYSVRIARDGTLLDGTPVHIVDSFFSHFSVASNGHTIALGTKETVLILNEELEITASLPRVDLHMGTTSSGAIASDGTEYLVVGESLAVADPPHVATARLSGTGRPISAGGQVFDVYDRSLLLTWTGTHYLLAHYRSGGGLSIQPLDREGNSAGASYEISTVITYGTSMASAGDGSALLWWFTYEGEDRLPPLMSLVDSSGASEPRPVQDASESQSSGTPIGGLASNGRGYLGSIRTPRLAFVPYTLAGDRVAPDISPELQTPRAQLDFAADRHRPADLILWSESDFERRRVLGRRVDARAVPYGDTIEIAPSSWDQAAPAIASNGNGYLAAWIERADRDASVVRVRVLNNNGRPAGDEPLTLGSTWYDWYDLWDEVEEEASWPPAVVWDGSVYLVAFPTGHGVMGVATISAGGELLNLQQSRSGSGPSKPVFARGSALTLLAWQDGQAPFECGIICPSPIPGRIIGIRIAQGGSLIDGEPMLLSHGATFELRPDAASDGSTTIMVTWIQGNDVRVRRLTMNGLPYDARSILVGTTFAKSKPSLTYDGRTFIAAWETETEVTNGAAAVSITREGEAKGRFAFSRPRGYVRGANVWLTPAGSAAIAYQHYNLLPETRAVPRLAFVHTSPMIASQPRRRAVAAN